MPRDAEIEAANRMDGYAGDPPSPIRDQIARWARTSKGAYKRAPAGTWSAISSAIQSMDETMALAGERAWEQGLTVAAMGVFRVNRDRTLEGKIVVMPDPVLSWVQSTMADRKAQDDRSVCALWLDGIDSETAAGTPAAIEAGVRRIIQEVVAVRDNIRRWMRSGLVPIGLLVHEETTGRSLTLALEGSVRIVAAPGFDGRSSCH